MTTAHFCFPYQAASSVKADPQSLPFLLQSLLSSSFTTADDAPSHGLKDVFQGAADADVPSRSGSYFQTRILHI